LRNFSIEDRKVGASVVWPNLRRDVDRDGGMIRLRAENSKNGKPRLLPLLGALTEIVERRWIKRRLDCTFVFHRGGRQIRSFSRVGNRLVKRSASLISFRMIAAKRREKPPQGRAFRE
jgi:integrase